MHGFQTNFYSKLIGNKKVICYYHCHQEKKSLLQKTPNLSTNTDRRTDTERNKQRFFSSSGDGGEGGGLLCILHFYQLNYTALKWCLTIARRHFWDCQAPVLGSSDTSFGIVRHQFRVQKGAETV